MNGNDWRVLVQSAAGGQGRGGIAVEGVAKSFGETQVLSSVNLTIPPRSFLTLLGPSGCGKTTLLRLIAGFIDPSEGRILIDGRDMAGLPARRRPVGMVFQNLALFPHRNVFENIAYGLQLRGCTRDEVARRVGEFITLVGLTGLGERRISQLSGGQKQRVALARSLVLEPSILLLDEPLSALDLQLRKQLQIALKEIQRKLGTTFVFVTHDQEEATLMSDTIVVMSEGEVQQVGAPRDIYSAPANLFVAKFIGEINEIPATVVTCGEAVVLETPVGVVSLPRSTLQNISPAAGDAVVICLRPEDLTIATKEPPPGQIQLRAEMIDSVSLGPISRFIVRAGGLRLASIMMSAERPDGVATGTACTLGFDPAKAKVFAPLSAGLDRSFGDAA